MREQTSTQFDPPSLSVRHVVGALFRHKGLILAAFLMTAVCTAAATLLMPDKYESRMKILVKNTRADVVVTPERTNGAMLETDVTETKVNSEIELLTSKDLLERVVRECNLAASDSTKKSPETTVTPVDIEKAVRRLGKDLTITPVKKANIIEVAYVARSPVIAASVLRKLSELYLEKHLRLHRPPGTYQFFKAQADRYGAELGSAEARLAEFQQRLNIVSLAEQKGLNLRRLAEAETKMLEADATINETTNKLAVVENQLRTLEPRIITQSRTLPNQYSAERLNTMLVELRNRRTQLLTKFKPDDRFVREVDRQIEDTNQALERATKQTAVEQATDLNPLRQQIQAELARGRMDEAGLKAKRASLVAQVHDYQRLLASLESATVEHDNLTRAIKTAADNYELYTRKRDEAHIADALDERKITNVAIAEAPNVPALPTKPNRRLNFALGLFFACFVGASSAFCAEFFRETVHTPQELEALTGVPTLAAVPHDPQAD